ncbi:hypothetical protein U0070_002804 [Myodes glareolus]|uniref:Uncharacterized protein n=1 Tax=Myodes glareolus TaxID=447135 RepID=A0AAW0HDX9_MYOGA
MKLLSSDCVNWRYRRTLASSKTTKKEGNYRQTTMTQWTREHWSHLELAELKDKAIAKAKASSYLESRLNDDDQAHPLTWKKME